MKFLVMHKHDKQTEAGILPPASLIAAMGELVGGMAASGQLLDGAGLGPTATRSRIRLRGGERTVTHGPYTSPAGDELPAGIAMVQVKTRDEGIDVATRIGKAIGGDVDLELGKVNEPWDIGVGEKPADAPLRYLVVQKATPATEAGNAPDLTKVHDELRAQGVLISAAQLTPSSRGKRLNWKKGSKKTVVDGPFIETKELVGGYAILQMASMEEVVAFCDGYAEILLSAGDTLEIDIRPLA